MSIVNSLFTAFDCSPTLDARSVYLDISKAFDRVWHQGLICKLRQIGVSGKLLILMQSFLSDKKQRTISNGKTSTWYHLSWCSPGLYPGSSFVPRLYQ